jgi:uncharacterized ubiquitin-like protein YukD
MKLFFTDWSFGCLQLHISHYIMLYALITIVLAIQKVNIPVDKEVINI